MNITPPTDEDTIRGQESHRWGLGVPAGRTHLTVGLHKLECFHQAKGLLYAPAHRQVIDAHVPHHTVRVDDEQAPEGQDEGL